MVGLGIMLAIVLPLLGAAAYGLTRFSQIAGDIKIDEAVARAPEEKIHDIATQPFNILLVGVDYRADEPDEPARSDTMIVVHVDPVNKWASMLSIPRDSYAEIPRKGTVEKINAAYSYGYLHPEEFGPNVDPLVGGITLTREAVEKFLDLKSHGTAIHYVAQIDFDGFKEIIDTIGGINIDVPKPLIDPQYPTDDGDYGFIRLFIPAGLQHMDGVTALRYARSRHSDSDFGRSARQQQVLRAIMESMKERGLMDQLVTGNDLLDVLRGTVRTSLPVDDLGAVRSLAEVAKAMAGDRMQSYSMVDSVQQTEEGSMIFWNEEDLSVLVDQWLRGPGGSGGEAGEPGPNPDETPTPEPGVTVKVFNGTGVTGLAGGVTECLRQGEYETEQPDNAVETYAQTRVIDFSNKGNARHHLLGWLDLGEEALLDPDDAPEPIDSGGADLVLIVGDDYDERWLDC